MPNVKIPMPELWHAGLGLGIWGAFAPVPKLLAVSRKL